MDEQKIIETVKGIFAECEAMDSDYWDAVYAAVRAFLKREKSGFG